MVFSFLEERYDNTLKACWKPKLWQRREKRCVCLISGLFLWRGFVSICLWREWLLASLWPLRLFSSSFTLLLLFSSLCHYISHFISLYASLQLFLSSPSLRSVINPVVITASSCPPNSHFPPFLCYSLTSVHEILVCNAAPSSTFLMPVVPSALWALRGPERRHRKKEWKAGCEMSWAAKPV